MSTANTGRHPVLWALGLVFLAIAVVLGVQFHSGTGVFASKLPPSAQVQASQPKTIGEGVTVSGDAVPIKIAAAKAINAITPPFKSSTGKTPSWHVLSITPSGKLGAPMKITIPLDHKVGKNDLVLVAVNHAHTANGWTFVNGTISSDKQHITIVTTELSWFAPFWEDVSALGNEIKTEFIDGFTGGLLTKATPPSCPNQSKALADDYKSTVEAKDTIYACIDLVNGERIVKVVNRVKYPVEIKHTNMTIKTRGAFSLDLARLADFGDHLVLEPGDEATFSVKLNHGNKATIDTDTSKLALGLGAVDILAKAILTVFTKVDVQGISSKAEVLSTILDSKDCTGVLGDLNIGSIISKCFNDEMLTTLFGWKAVMIGPLMLFISAVDLGYALANAWDNGQKGTAKQNVTITRPTPNPFASFVLPGEVDPITGQKPSWHVHGFDMIISPNGTATAKWDASLCDNASDIGGEQCIGHSTYSLTSLGNGNIQGTVTSLFFTTTSGSRYNNYDMTGQRPVGATFTLSHNARDSHLLDWVWSNPAYNSSSEALCDPYASEHNNTTQYNVCGA